MFGILVVDKPQGITSHDVVAKTRRLLGTKKVGHAGTLDPLATGVLVLAIGPATRFLQYLQLEPKKYVGTALFGIETDTQDSEGKILHSSPVPPNFNDLLSDYLPSFTGEIQQIPPMFSAVKKEGKPLYRYALQGKEVQREPRKATIFSFEIIKLHLPYMEFSVTCSGGTYIRTLLHDLGQKIGCNAHLTQLRRTAVGDFTLDQAIMLDHISQEKIIPLVKCLSHLPSRKCDLLEINNIRHGQPIASIEHFSNSLVIGLDENQQIIAMLQAEPGKLWPICVIAQ